MPGRSREEYPTRRQFHQQLALLAAAPVAAATAGDALAQPALKELTATAHALVEVAQAQYGTHLTEQQLKSLAQSVFRSLLSADRMKKVPLRNSEEPVFLVPFDPS